MINNYKHKVFFKYNLNKYKNKYYSFHCLNNGKKQIKLNNLDNLSQYYNKINHLNNGLKISFKIVLIKIKKILSLVLSMACKKLIINIEKSIKLNIIVIK